MVNKEELGSGLMGNEKHQAHPPPSFNGELTTTMKGGF